MGAWDYIKACAIGAYEGASEGLSRSWNQTKNAWVNSDIGALLSGDFTRFWEMGKNSSIGQLLQGNFGQAATQFGNENRAFENALGINFAKNGYRDVYSFAEEQIRDDDPSTYTAGEKALDFVGRVGEAVDTMTTPVGIMATCAGAKLLGAAGNVAKEGLKAATSNLAANGATTMAKVVGATPAVASTTATVGGTVLAGKGVVDVVNAETQEETINGTDNFMLGLGIAGLGVATAKGAVEIAEAAGIPVNTGQNAVLQAAMAPIKAVTTPGSEIQANALSVKTGIIQPGATVLREGTFEVQAQSPAREVYKFDPNGTPEEVLAKNPHVEYEAETGRYYVKASWGENVYIDTSQDYMIATYGPGDYNAIEGLEFSRTYVEPNAYAADGTKNFINPADLKPGETIQATKASTVRFKPMPEGTRYMSKEGPATLQKDSVVMIDSKGRPYQNTVDFLVENNNGFSEEAMEAIRAISPEAAQRAEISALNAIERSSLVEDVAFSANKLHLNAGNLSSLTHSIRQNPEMVLNLATCKAPNGTRVFSDQDIAEFFLHKGKVIMENPEKILKIIQNPEFISAINGCKTSHGNFLGAALEMGM